MSTVVKTHAILYCNTGAFITGVSNTNVLIKMQPQIRAPYT
jgi:hypothetical protein